MVNSSSSANGRYYGKAVILDEWDSNDLAQHIQNNCTVKKSDCLAVLSELVEVMTEALQDSKKVRINGLGSFKIGLKTESAETADEFTADNIKGFRVNFTPEVTIDSAGNRQQTLINGVQAKAYGEYIEGVNDTDM